MQLNLLRFLPLITMTLFWVVPGGALTPNFPRLKVGVVVSPPAVNATIQTTSEKQSISQFHSAFPSSSALSKTNKRRPSPSIPPIIEEQSTKIKFSGIAIDIWQTLAAFNKFKYDYYQIADFDQGIQDVAAHKIDVLVGPISITPERLRLVNFTQPYLNSHLAVLVREEPPTLWTIVQPLLGKAAIASIIGFLLIHGIFANLLWLAEHRKNSRQFPTRYWDGIAESLWFISVTMTTVGYGDKVPITHLGRLIAFIWMWLSLVLTTSITAGLATTLTLSFSQQINAKYSNVSDLRNVKVSTVKNLSLEQVINSNNLEAVEMPTLTDAINIFLLKDVEAVFYSENALRYFLQTNPNKSLKILPFYNLPINYGFAVPTDSPYLNQLNIGIAEMIENRAIPQIVNKWLR